MHHSWSVTWLVLAALTVGFAEPIPTPSVEPSTSVTTTTIRPSTTSEATDLDLEGQDQVAILKQINRVNDDGSYTFGYEAADGSFKIETRDVAGNVKGMFGFVDEGGELKRVSYSASNGTGFQSTGSPNVPPLVSPDDESSTRNPFQPSGSTESTTRISLLPGATTERPILPVYIYKSTTHAPRPEVIQHIPKLRPTPASLSTEPTESEEVTNIRRPAYGNFLPRKSSTPSYITLKPSTTVNYDETEEPTRRPAVVQIIRPRGYKRVIVTKRPVDASTTHTPVTTTEYYPVSSTYSSQLTEDEADRAENQRQIDINSVTEGESLSSGTEDSPDVFGGGPTTRPYPAGAYRQLFSPLPQYQRILQTSFLKNQNQFLAAGADPRIPPPIPGPGYGQYPNQAGIQPPNPNIPNRYQDPASVAQFAQFAGRGQQIPYPQGPAIQGQGPYPPIGEGQGRGLPYPPLGEGQGRGLPYPPDVTGRGSPYPPGAGDLGQGSPYPGAGQQYQGLPFPSGRPNVPPPGIRPQDYPVDPRGRDLPAPYPQQGPADRPAPYPQNAGQIPGAGRQPQTLPIPTSNPSQGLSPISNNIDDNARRQPPPYYNQPYPNDSQYGPGPANSQSYLMEQILRMLIASQMQSRQQPLTPFQQALISTLGPNNVPPELLGRNYDPRNPYQNYGPRQPFYPPAQYDPRYSPGYGGYPDPYAQFNYPNRANPYYQPNPYDGYNRNPYDGYNQGYTPNPYYQYSPEEVLLRMFLGPRFPAPAAPQSNPQIQNSPAAFDRSQQFLPRPPIGPEPQPQPQDVQGQFGQRIPQAANIVERSSAYTQRHRTSASKTKGSRNVQILEPTASESTSSTTSKPR